MSSDEFGNWNPTTPFATKVVNKMARPAQPAKSAAAGPSSKSSSGQKKGSKGAPKRSAQPDATEEEEAQQSEDDVEEVPAPADRSRSRTTTQNGRKASTTKTHTKPPAKVLARKTAIDGSSSAQVQELSDSEAAGSERRVHITKTAKQSSTGEVDRLRRKLKDVESQRDSLSRQLQDTLQVRITEPEEALQQFKQQAQAESQSQERLIQELTAQLARVEPLARSGKTPALHFLTREAADEEQRTLESRLLQLQRTLEEKNSQISQLTEREEELERDLKLEVARSSELAARGSRGQTPTIRSAAQQKVTQDASSPLQAQAIKFYEDLSNLLVTGIKFSRSEFYSLTKTEDYVVTCIYTFANSGNGSEPTKSLIFTLNFYDDVADPEDPGPITSVDQLKSQVKFEPKELDKESPQFRERLSFLGEAFTFERNQLPLFMQTLNKTMSEEAQSSEQGDEDQDMD